MMLNWLPSMSAPKQWYRSVKPSSRWAGRNHACSPIQTDNSRADSVVNNTIVWHKHKLKSMDLAWAYIG